MEQLAKFAPAQAAFLMPNQIRHRVIGNSGSEHGVEQNKRKNSMWFCCVVRANRERQGICYLHDFTELILYFGLLSF